MHTHTRIRTRTARAIQLPAGTYVMCGVCLCVWRTRVFEMIPLSDTHEILSATDKSVRGLSAVRPAPDSPQTSSNRRVRPGSGNTWRARTPLSRNGAKRCCVRVLNGNRRDEACAACTRELGEKHATQQCACVCRRQRTRATRESCVFLCGLACLDERTVIQTLRAYSTY